VKHESMNDEACARRKSKSLLQEPAGRRLTAPVRASAACISGCKLQAARARESALFFSAIRSAPRIVHRCCAIDADAIHARLCLGSGARRLRRHKDLDGVQSLPGRGRDREPCAGHEFLKIRPWRLQMARGFCCSGFSCWDRRTIYPPGAWGPLTMFVFLIPDYNITTKNDPRRARSTLRASPRKTPPPPAGSRRQPAAGSRRATLRRQSTSAEARGPRGGRGGVSQAMVAHWMLIFTTSGSLGPSLAPRFCLRTRKSRRSAPLYCLVMAAQDPARSPVPTRAIFG
jgi:hypothetical protein